MVSKRNLTSDVDDLKEDTGGDTPDDPLVVDLGGSNGAWRDDSGAGESDDNGYSNAVEDAVRADWKAQAELGGASSLCILTDGTVADYRERVNAAVASRDLALDADDVITALHPCLSDDGDQSFQETAQALGLTADQLDAVLTETARRAVEDSYDDEA